MSNILRKEMKLSASPLAFIFILFGAMFMVPGYPILCGAFFVTLGLFQSFQFAREANDIVFSALLPISKKEVVSGKFIFVCMIECFSLILMIICTIIMMNDQRTKGSLFGERGVSVWEAGGSSTGPAWTVEPV